MERYRKTNRSLEFLIHLFQFDIHPSENFETQFSVAIKEYIADHNLEKAIHDDIFYLIVSSICTYELFYGPFLSGQSILN